MWFQTDLPKCKSEKLKTKQMLHTHTHQQYSNKNETKRLAGNTSFNQFSQMPQVRHSTTIHSAGHMKTLTLQSQLLSPKCIIKCVSKAACFTKHRFKDAHKFRCSEHRNIKFELYFILWCKFVIPKLDCSQICVYSIKIL